MTKSEEEDPLNTIAEFLRVRPELQDLCRFGGTWAAPHKTTDAAQFHIVTRGCCLLDLIGQEPVRLADGDVLLLPRGDAHVVRSMIDGTSQQIVTEMRNSIRIKSTPDAPCDTEIVCGVLHFKNETDNAVIAALPNFVVLRSAKRALADRFQSLVLAIRDELDLGRAGCAIIAADLASALFIMMLREHLEDAPPANGLFALLKQRPSAPAVIAMLREPSRDWTLDMLAEASAASRSTLVRAFRKIAGMAPLAFLTELRLGLARQRLATTSDQLGSIAADVGYRSEAALSRALLRRYGVRPGKLRPGKAGK